MISRKRAISLFAFAVLASTSPLLAEERVIESGVALWKSKNTDPGSVSWIKLLQLMNVDLADAKQVNVFADLCHSGQVVDLQLDPKRRLNMPFSVGAVCKIDEISSDARSSSDKPWGRLQKRDQNDTLVDYYYMSYLAFLTKNMRAATLPGVKAMHDDAVSLISQENAASPGILKGTQQYTSGNGADESMTLKGGDNQHDLEFAGNLNGLQDEVPDQTFLALNNLNPKTLQYYVHKFNSQTYGKVKIDGQGTYDNLVTALGNIKTSLAANKNKDEVNLFFKGHGSKTTENVTPAPNAIPNMPKQGMPVAPPPVPDPPPVIFNVDMDSSLWRDLKEDVVLDDPTLTRADSPEFYISISEGTTPQPFNVTIDGISLGSMNFESSTTDDRGQYLAVPLSDSLLSTLIAAHDGESTLQIGFSLPQGDSFRLALDDDMLYNPLFAPTQVGTGITEYVSSVSQEVPEPATMSLIGCASILLCRRTRRVR